jgi:hypothetical protein
MLVPLDPKNGYKPVPKKDRAKWIEDEDGDAGLPYDPIAAAAAMANRTLKPEAVAAAARKKK